MSLSTKPPAFDKNDPAGTLRKVCTYLQQMQEELDFTLKQLQKSVNTGEKQ